MTEQNQRAVCPNFVYICSTGVYLKSELGDNGFGIPGTGKHVSAQIKTERIAVAKPRLGIIISMFPELHETFILRELVALERSGLQFDVYSLQFPRDPITIDDAIRLSQERTRYSSLINLGTLGALLTTLRHQPIKLLQTIAKVVWWGRDRPTEVIKNLAILPISLHFARIGALQGITHWHGHWANIPTTACWYLQQLCGQTWSAAIHGEDIFSQNTFLQKKLDAATFTVVCSGFFCKHLQQQLNLSRPADIHLNYHGLDPRVLQHSTNTQFKPPVSNGVFQLISIGRLVATKGHDVLIQACRLLIQKYYVNVQLQLIGSGPLEAELKELAVSEGISEQVVFRGALPFAEVIQALQDADVFCLAPRLLPGHPPDGIPNVLAEAMALRVPVVTTRVSAIPELVEDGVTGKLVAVDDETGLADAIHSLAADPVEAQRLSNAAFDKVGRLFNQQQNIEELLDLFERYVPGKVVG